MFYVLRQALAPAGSNGDMRNIHALEQEIELLFKDTSVLGLFVDNHDNPRFLNSTGTDLSLYRNALVYVLTATGIPIIYYGSEQG